MRSKFWFLLPGILCLLLPVICYGEYWYSGDVPYTIGKGKVIEVKKNKTVSAFVNGDTLTSNLLSVKSRELTVDLKGLPQFSSHDPLIDYLYKMALEEVILNINQQGYFVAGESWNAAWTRDTSYAVYLGLGFLFPQVSEATLFTRVDHDLILQDTGSGGSYPVSSDRIIWAMAAYETALAQNDPVFFRKVYNIVRKTMLQDIEVIFDPDFNLFKGETSFLDWREQTYPRWMEPADIGESLALGTNVVHYQALQRLLIMAKILKQSEDVNTWNQYLTLMKKGFKNFWLNDKGYFGNYIINGPYPYLYQGYETLGESLAVLSGLTAGNDSLRVLNAVKPGPYGMPAVAPQLKNIDPYHNNAVWPFVQAYRGWAAARAGALDVSEYEFAAMVRSAALFMTFKENLQADNGSRGGTAINSNRQLWSDAGYLAYIYRVFFGMEFTPTGLALTPSVFPAFKDGFTLKRFPYHGAFLDVEIKGCGNVVANYTIDGKKVAADYRIPANLTGDHRIFIKVKPSAKQTKVTPKLVSLSWAPDIPLAQLGSDNLGFNWVEKTGSYRIYRNGIPIKEVTSSGYSVKPEAKAIEYFVVSHDTDLPVLKGRPVYIEGLENTFLVEAESAKCQGGNIIEDQGALARLSLELNPKMCNGVGWLKQWGVQEGDDLEFSFTAPANSRYLIDFRYRNGHGPVNTGERCAIRELSVDNNYIKVIFLPQRGNWENWGFSSPAVVNLAKGKHRIRLFVGKRSHSQRNLINYIDLDLMRIRAIE